MPTKTTKTAKPKKAPVIIKIITAAGTKELTYQKSINYFRRLSAHCQMIGDDEGFGKYLGIMCSIYKGTTEVDLHDTYLL